MLLGISRLTIHLSECSKMEDLIKAITCEGHLEAVVVVHHGSDAIKAVAVKLVLIHPPARV